MGGIGIIGIGISGLHLALYLQQAGVASTVYAPYPMADVTAARLRYTPTRWAATLERERTLGLPDTARCPATGIHLVIEAAGIDLMGQLAHPADTTDFRMYLPWLLDAYLARGGDLRIGACGPEELTGLAGRHELVVVATGGGFAEVFPPDPARCMYRRAPREWTLGFFDGVELLDGVDVEIAQVPGVGEFYHNRLRSFPGTVSLVGVAALPAGPLAGLYQYRYEEDPAGLVARLRAACERFAPHVSARIDPARFAPVRALDVLQGAFVPYVRRGWACLDGRPVMALGDAWVLNDPIVAQGANIGSRCAFALGSAIVEQARAGEGFTAAFCQRAEAAMWAQAAAPTALTNAFLAPPTPHVLAVFARATHEPALADRLANGLADPEDMLALFTGEPASG